MGIGLILLFAGVLTTSMSCSSVSNATPVGPLYDAPPEAWQISGHFKEGQKLLVYFKAPDLSFYPDRTANILVEIVNPEGGKSVFEVVFSLMFGDPAPPEFNLVSNDAGLIVSDPLGEVGGIVPYSGSYLANITTRVLWGPPYLQLWGENVEKEYPYLSFLPVGLGLIVCGCASSVWGAKSSKKKARPRKANSV